MSKIEIVMIIIACTIPLISLVMILPKQLKKQKVKKEQNPPKAEPKQDSEPVVVEQEASEPKTVSSDVDFNTDQFKSYLNHKAKNTSKPVRSNKFATNLLPREDFFPSGFSLNPPKPGPQSIADEIKNLSPELKALIFSGALNSNYLDQNYKAE